MAKDPAFLFYPGDFSTGTQFFTDDQVGKYIRLLMAQHQHGHLSEEQVIFICKSYDKHIMSKFTKDKNGLWYNERLEIEVDKRKNYIQSRSKNRDGKTKENLICKSYDSHMENKDRNEDIGIIIKNVFGETHDNFIIVKGKYLGEPAVRINGKAGLIEYMVQNQTVLNMPEHGEKFMRKVATKRFNDLEHVQNAYSKYIENQYK